jgi:hypothetical protein
MARHSQGLEFDESGPAVPPMAPGVTADGPAPPDAMTAVLTALEVEVMRQRILEAMATLELDVSGVLIELQVTGLAPREGGPCSSVPTFTALLFGSDLSSGGGASALRLPL